MTIGPIMHTSNGPERMLTEVTPTLSYTVEPGTKKGKWSNEEWETVKNTLRTYSSLSLKSIRAYLSSTYAIEMSEVVLGRARREL
jgi:archaellum biogenesis protein FlaJ (TadC family)